MRKVAAGIFALAVVAVLAGCSTKNLDAASYEEEPWFDAEAEAELRADIRSMMDPSWCQPDIFGDETREDAIETMNDLAGGDLSDALGEGAGMDLGEDSAMDEAMAITVDEQFDYCESIR